MKRLVLLASILSLIAGLCSAATINEQSFQRLASVIQRYYGPSAAESKMYVGSEMCLACHKKDDWRGSLHATGFKVTDTSAFTMQNKQGVVADYNQNGVDDFIEGLDFNQISSAFDQYKPNAPILKYDDQNGYQIEIGGVTHQVKFAYGGSGLYKQRYVLKITTSEGQSAGHYISPVQYNEKTHQYVTYDPDAWWGEDNSPLITPTSTRKDAAAHGKSFDKGCAGCHFTGLSVWQDGNGEFRAEGPAATLYFPNDPHYYDFNGDRVKENFNTGCERCHGPGSQHILGRGDTAKIINPEKDLTSEQANTLCGSCHSRGSSNPNGTFGYPYDETSHTAYASAIGDTLDRFYTQKPGLWPDGRSSVKHHQQYLDFETSSKPTFAFHKVTCFECHDLHNNTKHNMVTEIDEDGLIIPTDPDNDTLCLACHATHGDFESITKEDVADYEANIDKIAMAVTKHTHHPYAPDREMGVSRCTQCHMPKIAKSAVAYDIHSHTFEVIPPAKTLQYQDQGGMPSSCAVRCHRPLAPIFGLPADPTLTKWNEPSDVALAQWLSEYYGPGGEWWDTNKDEETAEQ